jgi:acyl-coenzyme A thioesterase PaaI-like protein
MSVPGPDPFRPRPPLAWDGGNGFGPLIDAMRGLQDVVGGTNPPAEVIRDVAADLERIARVLRPWECSEAELIAGRRPDLPGRGHPFLPPFVVDDENDRMVRGSVRFTQFHLGGNGAVHGGAVPLLFDEVLGRLSNSAGRPVARTAYLHVNYRRITPVNATLQVDATIEREEGRKRFVTGRLTDGETLLADAEGLFVRLLPGQP